MTATTARPNSAARWQAAAERGESAGLAAFTVNGDPRHWFVTSGSAPGAGYVVTISPGAAPACGCKAAQTGDPICQHRAIVLRRLGMLPAAPVAAPTEDRSTIRERGRVAAMELFGEAA